MAEGRNEGGAPEPWELVSSEPREDYEIFRVRTDRARSPKDGEVHAFNIAESPGGVQVVALTEAGQLVLVEQYRHPFRRPMLELPAGIIDAGETPEDAGRRELREETGYAGDAPPERLGCVAVNPSWQTSEVHVVLVRNARRIAETDPDAGEDTRARLVSLDEARRMVLDGRIRSAQAVAALALLDWHGEAAV